MPVSNINCIKPYAAGTTSNPEAFKLYKVDDDTLKSWAWKKSQNDIRKVASNTAQVTLIGVPVVDTILSGVAHNGSLSGKIAAANKTASKWGLMLAAAAAVITAKTTVNKHFRPLDNFDKNHPILTTFTDAIAIAGTALGTIVGLKKASKFIIKKHGKSIVYAKNIVKNALNNSRINNRIVKPIETYLENHSYTNKGLKFTAAAAAPVMLVSALIRYRSEVNTAIKTANKTYKNLKIANDFLPEKPVETQTEETAKSNND